MVWSFILRRPPAHASRLRQLVALESPLQGGIDDAFIIFEAGNQFARVPVKELHVGGGALVRAQR